MFFWASPVAQWAKNQFAMQETQEMRVWSLGGEDPLEKEMATHSSILAWKIPWMEEPGRLQLIELLRVGHEWVTNILKIVSVLGHYRCIVRASLRASKSNTHVFCWQAWLPSSFYPGLTLGREDLLGREMATHSSTLAWKIPWMEEPGRLQFMGSQRVQHDWTTSLKKLSDLDKIQARASLRPRSFFSVLLSLNDLLNIVFHFQIFTDFPSVS